MPRSRTLKKLMSRELPPLKYQKKAGYRTTLKEVKALYRLINASLFNNKLAMPKIKIKAKIYGAWADCQGDHLPFRKTKSRCEITLSRYWYCRQWLIITLAHEMAHQYQWDIISHRRHKKRQDSIMSHGPTFFRWRKKFERHGVPLKQWHNTEEWFKTQHVFKC